eukprot:jgi/Galph1/889/GphlegSOOS_G5721.1
MLVFSFSVYAEDVKIVDQSSYTGLSGLSGATVTLADFNGDRQLDLLLYDTSRKAIFTALWSSEDQMFVIGNRSNIVLPSSVSLVYVSVADFNRDGYLDVLWIGNDEVGRIAYGKGNGDFDSGPLIANLTADAMIMDCNGDLIPDIFIPEKRAFYVNSPAVRQTFECFVVNNVERNTQNGACQVKDPSSASFVDMNGDCLPDLVFLSSCGLEVWLNPAVNGKSFFELDSDDPHFYRLVEYSVLSNIFDRGSLLTFIDINKDGTTDVLASNPSTGNLIYWLNRQQLRKFGQLELEQVDSNTLAKPKTTSIDDVFQIPGRIYWGDIDFDGYPDLLFIEDNNGALRILKNRGNWKNLNESHFETIPEEETVARLSSNAIGAAVIDLRGGIDIIVVQQQATRLLSIQNHYPAEFFKAIALSGLSYFSSPFSYSPLSGNTFKMSYDGLNERVLQICSQCPQSAHLPLQSCDCLFGLKDMANYVAEVSLGTGSHTQRWENLMPNTVAVIWTVQDENSWWMEIFTPKRGGQMLGVIIVLTSLSFCLGIWVLILLWQERRQDKREQYRRVNSSGFGSF